MNGENRDGWLTKRQAADHFAVSVRTIDNWRKRGLQAHKMGGVVRFKRGDLAAFAEKCLAESALGL